MNLQRSYLADYTLIFKKNLRTFKFVIYLQVLSNSSQIGYRNLDMLMCHLMCHTQICTNAISPCVLVYALCLVAFWILFCFVADQGRIHKNLKSIIKLLILGLLLFYSQFFPQLRFWRAWYL